MAGAVMPKGFSNMETGGAFHWGRQGRIRRILRACMIGLCAGTAFGSGSAGIVFSVLEDGRWVAYHQSGIGAVPERVSSRGGADQMAARLSSDGAQIAFEAGAGEVQVYARGPGAKEGWSWIRTLPGAVRPAWQPATKDWLSVRYAVSGAGEDSDIYCQIPGRREPEILVRHTGNQDYPAVSPDGTQVAYASGIVVGPRQGAVRVFQQLWILDLRSMQVRQVFLDHAENIEPCWSPAGKELAFASNRSGRFEIWVVQPGGEGLRKVTEGPGVKSWPAWSPDGQRILLTVFDQNRYGLALVNAEGGEAQPYHPFGAGSKLEVRDADWK